MRFCVKTEKPKLTGRLDRRKGLKIGLLGLGTVGGGVYKLLAERAEAIARQINSELVIKKILVRDIAKVRKLDIPEELLTTDYSQIVNDPEIDIVVELLGGTRTGIPVYYRSTAKRQIGSNCQ